MKTKLANYLLAATALVVLSACATAPVKSPEEAVKKRAQARWDALLEYDYEAAYGYASPGYRSATTLADFEIDMRLRRVQHQSAENREVRCTEQACDVKMLIGYKVVRPVSMLPEWESTQVVDEKWIFTGGEWWYVAK